MAIFTRKHQPLFRPSALFKRDSNTGAFPWILRNFKSKYFEEYPRTVLPLNVAALFLDKGHRRKLPVWNLVNLSSQLHYLNYVFPDAVVILSVLMRVKEVVFVYSRRDIYWYTLIGNLLWSNKLKFEWCNFLEMKCKLCLAVIFTK